MSKQTDLNEVFLTS